MEPFKKNIIAKTLMMGLALATICSLSSCARNLSMFLTVGERPVVQQEEAPSTEDETTSTSCVKEKDPTQDYEEEFVIGIIPITPYPNFPDHNSPKPDECIAGGHFLSWHHAAKNREHRIKELKAEFVNWPYQESLYSKTPTTHLLKMLIADINPQNAEDEVLLRRECIRQIFILMKYVEVKDELLSF